MKALITIMTLLIFSTQLHAASKVLIVVTSHDKLGETGKKTGFWLPELTHPYYELKKAGIEVDVASPRGGIAPIDQKSLEEKDEYNEVFLKDATLMRKVLTSIPLKKIDPKNYEAIIFAGGSGAMWDFPKSQEVNELSAKIYEQGGIVSAICHGPAALINIKLSNGEYLVKGKKLAAFTNEEEDLLGLTKVVPYLLQDKLIERGAKHIYAKPWTPNIVSDGRLITGQNPASANGVAKEIIRHLKN